MKFFDLGALQNKMQIPLHDKIFQVLFGAFHITSRIMSYNFYDS